MLPIGTRVTIQSVDHLAHNGQPKRTHLRLLGRTGVVTMHDDGMNVISGLGRFERFLGYWTFDDDQLTPAS